MYSFDKALKTISYYTRSKSSMDAVAFTIMEDKIGEIVKGTEAPKLTAKEELPIVCYKGCESCSS